MALQRQKDASAIKVAKRYESVYFRLFEHTGICYFLGLKNASLSPLMNSPKNSMSR